MSLTPEQIALRRLCVGSSDAPAILGVDPYRGPLEVYASKVFDLEEEETGEPARLGNRFEGAILEESAEMLGLQIVRNVRVQGPESFLAANLDALVAPGGALGSQAGFKAALWRRPDEAARLASQAMEAKFTGLGHLFGEAGSDQVPEKVLVQTAHQMGCLESLELVHVPVLLARYGRPRVEIFRAPRVPDLVEIVLEECRRFWLDHVVPRIPPDPSPRLGAAALGVLKRVRRTPHLVAKVDPKLVELYRRLQKHVKRSEGVRDRVKAELLSAMGEAEGADFGDERKMYAYLLDETQRFDLEAFRKKHKNSKYYKTTKSRTLRLINKRIGGKV